MKHVLSGEMYSHTSRKNNPYDVDNISLALLDSVIKVFRRLDSSWPCRCSKRVCVPATSATRAYTYTTMFHPIYIIKPEGANDTQVKGSDTEQERMPEPKHVIDHELNLGEESEASTQVQMRGGESGHSSTDSITSET